VGQRARALRGTWNEFNSSFLVVCMCTRTQSHIRIPPDVTFKSVPCWPKRRTRLASASPPPALSTGRTVGRVRLRLVLREFVSNNHSVSRKDAKGWEHAYMDISQAGNARLHWDSSEPHSLCPGSTCFLTAWKRPSSPVSSTTPCNPYISILLSATLTSAPALA